MQELQPLLPSDGFLAVGGVVGFFCKHAYARHRGSSGSQETSHQLKGIDRAFFLTLQALGLLPKIRPVLDQNKVREDAEEYEEHHCCDEDDMDEDLGVNQPEQSNRDSRDQFHFERRAAPLQIHRKLQTDGESLALDYEDADLSGLQFASFQDRLAFVLSNRTIRDFPRLDESRESTIDRIGSASGDIGLNPGQCQGIGEKYEVSKHFPRSNQVQA